VGWRSRLIALVPIVEKLNLDFNRYINVHASAAPQTKSDVWKAMGKQDLDPLSPATRLQPSALFSQ